MSHGHAGLASVEFKSIHFFGLLLYLFIIFGHLLYAHLFEKVVSQRWLFVQVVDLVPNHLIVLVPLSHLDLEQALDIFIKLEELLDVVRLDTIDVIILVWILFLDHIVLLTAHLGIQHLTKSLGDVS